MASEQTSTNRSDSFGGVVARTSRPGGRQIWVLLADDHAIVRSGVRRVLEPHADIGLIGEAASGDELLRHPALASADVLLLDDDMPDSKVLNLAFQCRRRAPGLRVLLFTSHTDHDTALDGAAAGVVGKDRPVEELVHAVRAVGRGGAHRSGEAAGGRRAVPRVQPERPPEAMPHEKLSERERQIFDRLVRGASPKDIASELSLGSSTVATYLQRIRDKFRVESTFELVRYAFRSKLVA